VRVCERRWTVKQRHLDSRWPEFDGNTECAQQRDAPGSAGYDDGLRCNRSVVGLDRRDPPCALLYACNVGVESDLDAEVTRTLQEPVRCSDRVYASGIWLPGREWHVLQVPARDEIGKLGSSDNARVDTDTLEHLHVRAEPLLQLRCNDAYHSAA
jgi:hypothetical protein